MLGFSTKYTFTKVYPTDLLVNVNLDSKLLTVPSTTLKLIYYIPNSTPAIPVGNDLPKESYKTMFKVSVCSKGILNNL